MMMMQNLTTRVALSLAAASMCFLSIPVALAADEGDSPLPAIETTSVKYACAPVDPEPYWPTDPIVDETGDEGWGGDQTEDTAVDETTENTGEETTDTTIDETTENTGEETTDTTVDETTENTGEETTDTTVDDSVRIARPCWYGVINPGYCHVWQRWHIDPPVIVDPPVDTIEPQEPPFVDETTDPTDTTVDETTDPTDTTVDETTDPTDTTVDETTDPTDTTVDETTDPTDTTVDDTTVLDERPFVYCYMKPVIIPDGPLATSESGSTTITGFDSSVFPADNSFDGGLLTIYGTGFRKGSTVMIGDQECTDVELLDESQLTCDPPNAAVGVYDVTVISPDGETTTAAGALEFMDPAGFWTRPIYAYSDNPLVRTLIPTTSTSQPSGAETMADTSTSATADSPAIPVFTG